VGEGEGGKTKRHGRGDCWRKNTLLGGQLHQSHDSMKQLLFSLFSMTRLGNTQKVGLLSCCLLINITRGVKLLYY
jgi:hypothetical protein